MSDENPSQDPPSRATGLLSPGNLMTSKATGIAAFAFACFSMQGQGSWSTAVTSLFWGTNVDPGAVDLVMVAWGVGCLLMAGLGMGLANRTLQLEEHAWEAHLARAAVLVAAVGAVLALLTIVGGFLH